MNRRGKLDRWWVPGAFTLVLQAVVLAPFGVIVAGALLNTNFLGMSTERWAGDAGASIISVHWFRYVWDLYHGSLGFSVQLALLSTILCLVIGVPGAYAIARSTSRTGRLLEAVTMLPLSLPGIALSIALIQAYAPFRGSWGLILCGHLLYTLPFMIRINLSALRSFDLAQLELCASGLGATLWQRFTLVVLPNLRPAMISGSLSVFAVSWGEFNVSFLLNTPLHQTYPAALYATYTSNSFQVASAATCIFLCGIIPLLLMIQLLDGRVKPQVTTAG